MYEMRIIRRAFATTCAGPQPQSLIQQVWGELHFELKLLGAAGAAGLGCFENCPKTCFLRPFSHTHFSSPCLSPHLPLFLFVSLLLFILLLHNLAVLICLLLCLCSSLGLLSKTNSVSAKLLPFLPPVYRFLPLYVRIHEKKNQSNIYTCRPLILLRY